MRKSEQNLKKLIRKSEQNRLLCKFGLCKFGFLGIYVRKWICVNLGCVNMGPVYIWVCVNLGPV